MKECSSYTQHIKAKEKLLHTIRLDHRAVQALKQEQKCRNINNLSILDKNRLSLPLI